MKKIIVIIVMMLLILSGIYIFDYNKVKLKYISTATIVPPISKYRGESFYAFFINNGEDLKEYVENYLFPECYISPDAILDGKPFPIAEPYKIKWDKNFIPKTNKLYYICLGCKINNISYLYHTKFTNDLNSKKIFEIYSTSLKPLKDKSIITIYEGDVKTISY